MRKKSVNQDKNTFSPKLTIILWSSKLQKKNGKPIYLKCSFLWNALEKAISKKGIFCNTLAPHKQGESECLSVSGYIWKVEKFSFDSSCNSYFAYFSDQGSVMLSPIMDLRKIKRQNPVCLHFPLYSYFSEFNFNMWLSKCLSMLQNYAPLNCDYKL